MRTHTLAKPVGSRSISKSRRDSCTRGRMGGQCATEKDQDWKEQEQNRLDYEEDIEPRMGGQPQVTAFQKE